MGNCFMSSDGSNCSTAIGSCENKKCASSCTKKTQETAVHLEEVVDSVLKKWIDDHLHHYLRKHLPNSVADTIEDGLMDIVNTDIVPRLSIVKEEQKSASDDGQPKSPSNI
jgi:hypothetical protein